jgi:hypothetical protein
MKRRIRLSGLLRAAAPAILGAAGTTACSDHLDHPATYHLVSAADAPLPFTAAEEAGCTIQIVGGSMRLVDDSSYVSSYALQRVCRDGQQMLPDPGATGIYRTRRDSVFFYNSDRDRVGAARITPDSMIIRGPEHTLIFRRTDDS